MQLSWLGKRRSYKLLSVTEHMKQDKFIIGNKLGIHARPAAELAKMAARYKCEVMLSANNKTANAKSLMLMMALGARNGTELTLSVNGEDEEEAFTAIGAFIENHFNEA